MSESGLLGSLERARKAAEAVRAGTEKARESAALDPANAPQVILAEAATRMVLESLPVQDPALTEAMIKKAGKIATGYATGGTKPLPTPSEASSTKRTK